MGSREELQREIEDKIESQKELLSSYFYSLGSMAFNKEEELGITLAGKLKGEAENALIHRDEAEAELKKLSSFHEEYQRKSVRKSELETLISDVEDRIRDEKIKLGAVIYEKCSLQRLDNAIFSTIYKDVRNEKALVDKQEKGSIFSKFISRAGLNNVRASQEKRYLRYADEIIDRNLASVLKGDSAETILGMMDKDNDLIRETKAELAELVLFLDQHEDEDRKLERSGLDEAIEWADKKNSEYYESVVNYGNYLYDKGSSWVGENTPSEILDLLQSIIEGQDAYARLYSTRERLRKEAKADDYKSLIEQEKAKILILNKEKEKIDIQIAKIETEIQRLSNLIDRLER